MCLKEYIFQGTRSIKILKFPAVSAATGAASGSNYILCPSRYRDLIKYEESPLLSYKNESCKLYTELRLKKCIAEVCDSN